VKHLFKVAFLLAIATVLFIPCDPDGDGTISSDIAIVLEREVGSSRQIVRANQPMPQQARRPSLYTTSAFQRHFKQTSSIVDLTCSRLC
jgi:hypothetical protein